NRKSKRSWNDRRRRKRSNLELLRWTVERTGGRSQSRTARDVYRSCRPERDGAGVSLAVLSMLWLREPLALRPADPGKGFGLDLRRFGDYSPGVSTSGMRSFGLARESPS